MQNVWTSDPKKDLNLAIADFTINVAKSIAAKLSQVTLETLFKVEDIDVEEISKWDCSHLPVGYTHHKLYTLEEFGTDQLDQMEPGLRAWLQSGSRERDNWEGNDDTIFAGSIIPGRLICTMLEARVDTPFTSGPEESNDEDDEDKEDEEGEDEEYDESTLGTDEKGTETWQARVRYQPFIPPLPQRKAKCTLEGMAWQTKKIDEGFCTTEHVRFDRGGSWSAERLLRSNTGHPGDCRVRVPLAVANMFEGSVKALSAFTTVCTSKLAAIMMSHSPTPNCPPPSWSAHNFAEVDYYGTRIAIQGP